MQYSVSHVATAALFLSKNGCVFNFQAMCWQISRYCACTKCRGSKPLTLDMELMSFQYVKHHLSTGDVWFSLRNTTYQNNSIVILENIGEGDGALLCITNQTACCRPPYTSETGPPVGNWFFPNGTTVFSEGNQSDFYSDRGQMVVRMNRRRGGVEGIYRCEIPGILGFTQIIYIGVYSASTGEW